MRGGHPAVIWSNVNGVPVAKNLAAGGLVSLENLPLAMHPRNGFVYYTDFMSGLATQGTIDDWFVFATGTSGAVGVGAAVLDDSSLGVQTLTAAGNGSLAYGGIARGTNTMNLGTGISYIECRVKVSALSIGAQPFELWLGVGDNIAGADPADGVYFNYDETNHGDFWVGSVANNSSVTDLVFDGAGGRATAAVVADTYYRLGIVADGVADTAEFFVDGVSKGTTSSALPITAGRECAPNFKIAKTTGANVITASLDYVYVAHVFTTAR